MDQFAGHQHLGASSLVDCPSCEFHTISTGLLQIHISQCHAPPLMFSTFTCTACNSQSTRENIMNQHLLTAHPQLKASIRLLKENHHFTDEGFRVEEALSNFQPGMFYTSQTDSQCLMPVDNNCRMSTSNNFLLHSSATLSHENGRRTDKRPISTDGKISDIISTQKTESRACHSAPPTQKILKCWTKTQGQKTKTDDRLTLKKSGFNEEPEQEEALDMTINSKLFSEAPVTKIAAQINEKITPALQMMQQMAQRFPFPYYSENNYPSLSTLLSTFAPTNSLPPPPPNYLNFYKSLPSLPSLPQRPPPPIRDLGFPPARPPWSALPGPLPDCLPNNPLSCMWNMGNQFRRRDMSGSFENNNTVHHQVPRIKPECNNNKSISTSRDFKSSKDANSSSQSSRNSNTTLSSNKDSSQDILVRSHRQNFTPLQNRILLEWYHQHHDKPYPSTEDTKMLAKRANLSYPQVKKWFANKRARTSLCSKNRVSKQHSSSVPMRQPTLPFAPFQHSFGTPAGNGGPPPYNSALNPSLLSRIYSNYSRMKLTTTSLPANNSALKIKHKDIYN